MEWRRASTWSNGLRFAMQSRRGRRLSRDGRAPRSWPAFLGPGADRMALSGRALRNVSGGASVIGRVEVRVVRLGRSEQPALLAPPAPDRVAARPGQLGR